MKTSRINLVIALCIISLVGILVLQGAWLKHSADNYRNRFDYSVNAALNDAVATLEKRSVFRVFTRHLDADSIKKFSVKLHRDNKGEINFNLHDTLLQVTPLDDTLKYIHHDIRNFIIEDNSGKEGFTKRVDSIVAEIVSDLEMDTLVHRAAYQSQGLDTIIRHALWQKGINNHFDYAIMDFNGEDGYKSEGFDSTMTSMVYRVRLMPSHIGINQGELLVIIHRRDAYIIHSAGYFILASLMFTLFITVTFWLSIRTILKQKKISQVKNDFINNMTHEFKTPLATIGIAADALKDGGIKPAQVGQFAEIIKQESRNMNQKVETILQMALLEQQQLKLELEKCDIHVILKDVLNRMQLAFEKNNAIVTTTLNAAQHYVMGDELHLCNVFENILDNAVKYSSDTAEIHIRTGNTGKTITVTISDYGIGMTPEEVKHAFDRFYRAQGGNLHNTKGFGLGLSYAHEIITLHNGTIEITSEKQKGTTVTVNLPVYE